MPNVSPEAAPCLLKAASSCLCDGGKSLTPSFPSLASIHPCRGHQSRHFSPKSPLCHRRCYCSSKHGASPREGLHISAKLRHGHGTSLASRKCVRLESQYVVHQILFSLPLRPQIHHRWYTPTSLDPRVTMRSREPQDGNVA